MFRKMCSYLNKGNVLFISCEKYAKLASRKVDTHLHWYEQPGFFFHHLLCTVCRRFKRQIELIDMAAARVDQMSHCNCSEVLSDERKEKIKSEIAQAK